MIVTNICLLLEALSIVICLHHLYGEKFRLDIKTISFLSIDMILMTVINYYGMPKTYTMIIYPILALYCGARFGFQLKSMVVNLVLCIVLIGSIQAITLFPIFHICHIYAVSGIGLLLVSCIEFAFVLVILSLCKIEKLSKFLQHKERFSIIIIGICVIMVLIWMLSYKNFKILDINQAVTLLICVVLIVVLVGQVSKYKIKAKEIEMELKMQKLYSASFQGLIDHIRMRQHEFNNHINTIYSQHYTHKNYEDLVNAQKHYCELVMKENRFSKLLSGGNPIIVGFLYGKFVEIEKLGIDVGYKVADIKDELEVPEYKVVEILGDLINNAVEALSADEERNKLYVSVIGGDSLTIEVRNESPHISYAEFDDFFTKGYSKKGENRGLGLYNVKQICEEYHMEISCDNIEIDGSNWLYFGIAKEKGTI